MIFYVSFAAIAALLVLEIGPTTLLLTAAKIMLLGATLMSAIFTYLQWRVIKAWCFWCLLSASTVVLLDLITLTATLT